MVKISEEFPSNYLKAADLNGREPCLTMGNVEREKLGDDTKPVLYFKSGKKGLVLNKTNSNTIAMAYGDDSDDWFGKEVILYSAMIEFGGKTAPAIRVRVPPPKSTSKANKPDPISSGPARAELDEEIPF